MNKIFFICPDCFLEQKIRQFYGPNCYFVTALGAVFDYIEFEQLEEIHHFLEENKHLKIYIVNDYRCSFISNALKKEESPLIQERTLIEMVNKQKKSLENLGMNEDKSKMIANLNILRQAYEFTESEFLSKKLNTGEVSLTGLIYDRKNDSFQEIVLNF